MSVTVLNDDNFNAEVIESDVPVVVDFFTTWCGPCKTIAPIVEKLAGEFEGRIKVGKLNLEEAPNAGTEFKVRAVPTILFFKGGQVVDQFVGPRPEGEFRTKMESLLA